MNAIHSQQRCDTPASPRLSADGKTLAMAFCCTPFQAVLLKRVLRDERVDKFHLFYIASRNSEEDESNFREIAKGAERVEYVVMPQARFDIVGQMRLYAQIEKAAQASCYDKILLANFDKLALRRFVGKRSSAEVVTFDDGSGNVNLHSQLATPIHPRREAVYAALLNALTTSAFPKRVNRHYSIYRGFVNIMPRAVVTYVDIFSPPVAKAEGAAELMIFIGQPIDGASETGRVERIKRYLAGMKIDFYIKHPRETIPLMPEVPLLNKKGRIAEEAIFELGRDRRLTIIGGFSSVLLNVAPRFATKVMILNAESALDRYLATLGEKVGCKVVFV